LDKSNRNCERSACDKSFSAGTSDSLSFSWTERRCSTCFTTAVAMRWPAALSARYRRTARILFIFSALFIRKSMIPADSNETNMVPKRKPIIVASTNTNRSAEFLGIVSIAPREIWLIAQ